MKKTRRRAGHSLVEALTTLAVLLGLYSLAWPSMTDWLTSIQLRSAADALWTSLNLCRASAVQHGTRVAMCKSVDGSSCLDSLHWEQGWVIFYDNNNSGTLDPDETVLQRQEAFSGQLIVKANEPVSHYVSYTALGQAKLLGGSFQAGTFTVCSAHSADAGGYQVIVAASGRARLAKATAAQCH